MFNPHSHIVGDIVHYYSGDPAFDKELRRTDVEPPPDAPEDWQPPPVFDHRLWVETKDEKYLPRKPNAAPVQFVLKRLNPDERAFVEDKLREGEMTAQTWAMRIAVQRIHPHPPGTPEVKHDTRAGFRVLCDEWIELLRNHDGGLLWFELVTRYFQELRGPSRT